MNRKTGRIGSVFLLAIAVGVMAPRLFFKYGFILLELRPLTIEQIPARIELSLEYGFPTYDLNSQNVQLAKENICFPAMETKMGVVRISEDPKRNNILAIYENGKFRKWNIFANAAPIEYDFLTANTYNTFFNGDGSLLITTGEIIWDTGNGELLDCMKINEGCPTATTIADYPFGMYIDPVRPVKVTFNPQAGVAWTDIDWSFTDTLGVHNGGIACYDFIRDHNPYEGGALYNSPRIERIAIDPAGKYAACLIDNQAIIIRDWSLAFNMYRVERDIRTKEYPYIRYVRFDFSQYSKTVKDMSFDPTRTWLSVLTDRELVVWDLRHWFFARKLNVSVSDGNAIAFDRSGKMLALGTKRGITIYDVGKGKQITEFNVGEVTALYFTRDNRLLVWGDAEGNIHLWGVPQNK